MILAALCLTLAPADLRVGFAGRDITPAVGPQPVWLAGFGTGRRATAILDPLAVRTVVLIDGDRKLAIASVDAVGLFLPTVEQIRAGLPGFAAVLVSSTHNHHGPDTMGLWGPSPFKSGVDPAYIARVVTGTQAAVRDAERAAKPVAARCGAVAVPELLHDSRPPILKHDTLVALAFHEPSASKPAGLVVQWNCHPETLSSKNTRVSSDFVGEVCRLLSRQHGCPVMYLSGTVGGLMTSMHVDVRTLGGDRLAEGTEEKLRRFGTLVTEAADRAVTAAVPLTLTPFDVRTQSLLLPATNARYRLAKQLGVLDRPLERLPGENELAVGVKTEVGFWRLGELEIAVIPGEIYPELVLDLPPLPVDPAADFPDAPPEVPLFRSMRAKHRMIVGLGNDELGYILPKRQWDEKPPYTYGLTKPPYGEANSLGPDAGPLLCEAFRKLATR